MEKTQYATSIDQELISYRFNNKRSFKLVSCEENSVVPDVLEEAIQKPSDEEFKFLEKSPSEEDIPSMAQQPSPIVIQGIFFSL